MLIEFLLKGGAPWHELDTQTIIDRSLPTRRERDALAIDAGYTFAFAVVKPVHPRVGGAHAVQFLAASLHEGRVFGPVAIVGRTLLQISSDIFVYRFFDALSKRVGDYSNRVAKP